MCGKNEELLQLANNRANELFRLQQEVINLIDQNRPYPQSHESEILIQIYELLSEQR